MPSRLFIYYNERVIEGTVDEDSGAMIRDGIKSVHKLGVCDEKTWGYDISRFTEKPPAEAYTEAMDHQATVYRRVLPVLHQMQGCLAAGMPFVFGFSCTRASRARRSPRRASCPCRHAANGSSVGTRARRGIRRRLPAVHRAQLVGHGLGMDGYCTMPYGYLTDPSLARDFWAIYAVEKPVGQ